uniref:C-type lectin domain-containing protein n=1 Tax=Poecilia mexicana TaxID=48701 RepID=A0A3B3YY46_9TELE
MSGGVDYVWDNGLPLTFTHWDKDQKHLLTPVFLHSFPSFRPAGWMRFKDKCFMFKGKKDDIKANWSHARSWCRDQGGELAIIDNQYENGNYLKDLELPTWIGLSDLLVENHSYMWTDGWPVFFTQWGPGEPSNVQDEGCVSMHASIWFHGTWNDTKCDLAKPYICKISSAVFSS